MRRFGAAVAMLAGTSACLELNPAYVDGTTAVETNAGTEGGTTEVDATSTGTEPVDCTPDDFEPSTFDEPADASSLMIQAARLEGADAEDWYKAPLEPGGPAEVFARAIDIDLRVCFYVECDDGTPAEITKCAGDPTTENGLPGCCEVSSVGLEYNCGGTTAIRAHVRVDGGDDACPVYDLELGVAPAG